MKNLIIATFKRCDNLDCKVLKEENNSYHMLDEYDNKIELELISIDDEPCSYDLCVESKEDGRDYYFDEKM